MKPTKRIKVEYDNKGVYLTLSEENDAGGVLNKITIVLNQSEAEAVGEHIFRSGRNVLVEEA